MNPADRPQTDSAPLASPGARAMPRAKKLRINSAAESAPLATPASPPARRVPARSPRRSTSTWRPDLIGFSDLRRRQESHAVDWLLLRAEWLPHGDRDLIEAVYREGKSAAEIARLGAIGEPGRGPSVATVRNRIKQVVARLCSDKLPFVVERSPSWSPTRRRVARRCVVCGDSMRVAADHLGVSLHTVRRHMEAVNTLYLAWAEESRGTRSPGSRALSHASM